MANPNKFQIQLHYEATQYLAGKDIKFQNGQIERHNETVLTINLEVTDIYIFTDGAEFVNTSGRTSFEKRSFKNNDLLAGACMDHLRKLVERG